MVGIVFLALAAAPTEAPGQATEGYGPRTTESFVGGCVQASSERAKPFCECVMKELQASMSYEEFRALDRDFAGGKPDEANRSRMNAAAGRCAPAPRGGGGTP